MLSGRVIVEEKIDGENLGLSLFNDEIRTQSRGDFVEPGGQHFRGLASWLAPRRHRLAQGLTSNLTVFGEWCADAHTVPYDRLPDWLLIFDVLDRDRGVFWSADRRDALAAGLGIASVPRLGAGEFSLSELQGLMQQSRVGSAPMEGVVIRREADDVVTARAKLVRAGFSRAIQSHWRSASRTPNRLASQRPQLARPS